MSGVNKTYETKSDLEDCTGNIISQGFLMAEDLNGYFRSMFTREDISSLPVPDAKFQEAKSYYLGKGSRKSDNYRPANLTLMIFKLLERLIKDHMVDFLVRHKLLNSSQYGFLKVRSFLTNVFWEEITKWEDISGGRATRR